jgi:hypothetical protein
MGATYRIVGLSAPAEELIVKLIQTKSEFSISVRGTDADVIKGSHGTDGWHPSGTRASSEQPVITTRPPPVLRINDCSLMSPPTLLRKCHSGEALNQVFEVGPEISCGDSARGNCVVADLNLGENPGELSRRQAGVLLHCQTEMIFD